MRSLALIGLLFAIHPLVACPTPSFASLTLQANFSLHDFLGTWYEIKWYKNETEPNPQVWNDFTQTFQLENNSNNTVLAFGYARLSHEKECFSIGPWLIIANNSANMTVEKQNLTSTTDLNWPYYILKTDYRNYALIYGCMSQNYTVTNPCQDPMLWVLSRTVLLANEHLIEVDHHIMDVLCLNSSQLQVSLHSAKSCHAAASLGGKRCLISMNFFVSLLILYFFLTYK